MTLARQRAALLAIITLLLGSAAILLAQSRTAGAQPATETFVQSDIDALAANGFVTLGTLGRDDGVDGISCGPANPLAGPNIPGMVVTDLQATQTQLRVIKSTGTAYDGALQINCAITAEAGAAAKIQSSLK
jgi:hypothetical protein